ncbi:MAG TPA: glutathione S-transferase family protein [Alphaproteobacteria bacterium]|nr:glutathione S-transferase family protein [Alphaproteobacteria bacterium]
MYTLYYSPGACSLAIHVALNECNQQVKLEKVDLQAARTPELLKVNPRGQVPVLVDGDLAIREGAAQLIHILEKHKSPLLPTSEPERTKAIQWLMFCNASLHPAYGRVFFLKKNASNDATSENLMDISVKVINKMWAEIEEHLGSSQYLAGDNITVGDILMCVIANWGGHVPKPITIGPKTKKLIQTVTARPAFQKALQTEQVEYKAAA